MSLVSFDTDTQHILFNNWISEVHEKAKTISGQQDPAYLVYVVDDDDDEDQKTCVYFLHDLDSESVSEFQAKVIHGVNDCSLQLQSTPVHCNPTVDMSTMSFAEFAELGKAHNDHEETDLYDYAIEDVTIEKLIPRTRVRELRRVLGVSE